MVELLEWAQDRPLFNLNEAERASEYDRSYLRKKLSGYVKKGKLYRVERGKYTVHEDTMVYASHVENPSYISLWSGLNFYNLTTQEPTRVQVMCSVSREDLQGIQFYSSKDIFGYRKERYRGFEVFVAEEERLLLDILKFGEVPVDELEELIQEIDLQRLTEYCQRLGSKAVARRAGFLIQRLRGRTLEELKPDDSNYPLLDLTKPEKGEKNSEWRLKVNNSAF